MAVQTPSPELIQKVRDLNRFRTSQYARAGGAAIGGFPARLNEGSAAGAAYTDRMFARDRGGLSAEERARLKSKVIGQMGDIRSEAEANRLKAEADRIKAARDAGESKVKMFLEFLTNQGKVNQQAAAAMNEQIVKIRGDALAKRLETLAPGERGSASTAADAAAFVRWANAGESNAIRAGNLTPDFWRGVAQQLASKSSSERADFLASIAPAFEMGGAEFVSIAMEAAKTNPDARMVSEAMATSDFTDAAVSVARMGIVDEAEQETLAMLKRGGVPGLDSDTAMNQWEVFNTIYGNPDEFKASVEVSDSSAPGEATGEAPPDTANPKPELDALQKLLDEIDSDKPLPAGLAEARRRFLADPSFQKWKKDSGLQDDGIALRTLRRATADAVYKMKKDDRAVRQQSAIARAGGDVPKPTNAAAAAAGGAQGSASFDPKNVNVEGLTEEERTAVAEAMADEEPAAIPAAPAEPAPAPGKKIPNLKQAVADVGNVVLRPGATADRTAAKLLAKLRKQDPATDPNEVLEEDDL